jgi:hypothetical protein
LAHYGRLATRITVYDNFSTDGSREWLSANGTVVVDDAAQGSLDDRLLKDQKNSVWKASRGRADWVVVCDLDELVFISDLPRRLAWCSENGISCIKLKGFNMVSDVLPTHAGQIYDRPEFRVGAANPLFSNKVALFRPDLVDEINYHEGAHVAEPEGQGWLYGEDSHFALLHYKWLGPVSFIARRFEDRARNLSVDNRTRGYSLHFRDDEAKITGQIEEIRKRAHPLFSAQETARALSLPLERGPLETGPSLK